jgi:nitroreductase
VDIFEVMETARAIRYLKPDPVAPELIDKLVWAATRAPSPGNTQGWDFVVVTDTAKKATIGAAIATAMAPRLVAPDAADRSTRLMMSGAKNLATTIGTAPVLVLVCGGVVYPPAQPRESFTWSALYPAAQNLILAARALGLGSTFTTFHGAAEPTIRDVLGIPEHIKIGCLIPIGWPDREFGPVNRQPVESFIHRDGWQGDLRAGVSPTT